MLVGRKMAIPLVEFIVHYLFNTWWHTKKSLRTDMAEWSLLFESILRQSEESCRWLCEYLSTVAGYDHLVNFLLVCTSSDVRQAFGNVLKALIGSYLAIHEKHPCDPPFDKLIEQLLVMLEKPVIDHWQNSFVYFHILSYYATSGSVACTQLLRCVSN